MLLVLASLQQMLLFVVITTTFLSNGIGRSTDGDDVKKVPSNNFGDNMYNTMCNQSELMINATTMCLEDPGTGVSINSQCEKAAIMHCRKNVRESFNCARMCTKTRNCVSISLSSSHTEQSIIFNCPMPIYPVRHTYYGI